SMKLRYRLFFMLFILAILVFFNTAILAEEEKNIYKERMALYKKTEAITLVPWYYLAAVDQFERNKQSNIPEDQLVSIEIPSVQWFGLGNGSQSEETT